MPITVHSVTTAYVDTDRYITFDTPSGLQVGDIILYGHRAQNGREIYNGAPGFTRITPYPGETADGRAQGLWYKVVTDPLSEPATNEIDNTGAGTRQSVIAMILRGVDLADPIVDVTSVYRGTLTQPTLTTESLTSTAEAFQLFISGNEVTTHPTAPGVLPTGFTPIARVPETDETSFSRTPLWMGYRDFAGGDTGESSITWEWVTGGAAQSALLKPLGAAQRLATPVVTLGAATQPSEIGASDATQTITFGDVPDAASYTARLAIGSDPTENDFVDVAHDVASPYVFTGLASGTYAFGIQARR